MGRKLKYKICETCKKELPLTRKFFKRNSDDSFHCICRECEDNEKLNKEWKNEMLLCHSCLEYKDIDNFSPHGSTNPIRKNRRYICKECSRNNRENKQKSLPKEENLLKVLQSRFLCARDRSKRKNIQFNITKEYLKELWDKQNGKCAISGIEMTFEQYKGRIPTNVSIDQINPKNGYTIGNIQLVCMAVNQMKSDLKIDELYKFCSAILEQKNKSTKQYT